MDSNSTAPGRWSKLDGERQSFITRCEQYAKLTIPKICLPNGYDQESDELHQDYQSLGAQCTNHLANKLMLALFAPSRPFFRLDASEKVLATLQQNGMSPEDLANQLALAEIKAVGELDRRSIRPKMYDAMKHIIVTGNACLVLNKESMRVLGLKNYVAKRGVDGEVLEILIKERTHYISLDPAISAELPEIQSYCDKDDMVDLYRWIRRHENGSYTLETWIGDHKVMAPKFEGKWADERKCPYRAITWDLASGDDYGTGLVENYKGDFSALSIMSQATVQAAVLASEFRWLVNPAGMTQPEDFEKSENGAALAGVAGDITLIQSGVANNLQVNIQIAQTYINRLGSGFLLQSAVTRQAERVTAEEIRLTAEELETSLGGAYSRIAVDVQVPMAYWLLEMSGRTINGTDIEPTIVTGLAALSRSGDRDNLVLFFQDVSMFDKLSPETRARMKMGAIYASLASARGLAVGTYLLTEDEFQRQEQLRMQEQMAMELANRMPIASPEGVDASQALVAREAANAALDARSQRTA